MSLTKTSIVVFCLIAPLAQALSIAPTSLELDLRAGKAESELILSADAGAALDIEMTLSPRGDAAQPSVSIDLFPPQLSIPAGESRRVLVRARLVAEAAGSASYHLEIQPVGLEAEFEQASDGRREVRFRTRFLLPVHVDLGGSPALTCRLADGPNGRGVELTNPGSRYLRFGQVDLSLRDETGALVASYVGLALARPLGSDALLPGQTLSLPLGNLYPAATAAVCTLVAADSSAVR